MMATKNNKIDANKNILYSSQKSPNWEFSPLWRKFSKGLVFVQVKGGNTMFEGLFQPMHLIIILVIVLISFSALCFWSLGLITTYQFQRVTFRLYVSLSELEFHNKFLFAFFTQSICKVNCFGSGTKWLEITGMRLKAYFDPHTLRFAGLFNSPIFLHFVMKIGVSRYKKKLTITPPKQGDSYPKQ